MASNNTLFASSFIFINSKDRINSSDSSSNFQTRITDLDANSAKNLSIENIVIPYTYYGINSNNQTFTVNSTSVTLTPGNYTTASFITEMTSKLNAASLGTTFASTVSSTTGLLTLTSGIGTTFSVTSNTKNNRYLGMPTNVTRTSTANVLTTSVPVILYGTEYIQIETDLPIASTNTGNQNRNILTRVFPNCSPFETIFYNSSSFQFIKLLTNRLNQVSLTLRDDNGDILDLNGAEWNVTLEVCNY